jgi:hypothetical protein
MNAKDAILKIRALFEDMPYDEPKKKVEMEEYTLLDGTKVNVSELAIGGVVTLEDGSFAPMGEHTLADGSVIQLDEAGVILEIASPVEDEMPEEEMSKMVKKKMEEVTSEFRSQIQSLFNENKELKSKLASLEQKSKEGFSSVVSMFEDFSKLPSTDPIQKPSSFKFEKTNDLKFDRIEKYRNAILNNKN